MILLRKESKLFILTCRAENQSAPVRDWETRKARHGRLLNGKECTRALGPGLLRQATGKPQGALALLSTPEKLIRFHANNVIGAAFGRVPQPHHNLGVNVFRHIQLAVQPILMSQDGVLTDL